MEEDVALQRSHEEQRRGARVADAQASGGGGAAEVVGDDGEAAARRAVGVGIERQDQRGVLRHDDMAADHPLRERHELLGDPAQDHPRVFGTRRGRQNEDAGRRLDDLRAVHGFGEQLILRPDVAEERRGGDAQLAGDVGQGGGGEAFGGEDAPGGVEELIAADARRAAHL
jgi:hypothetical protein